MIGAAAIRVIAVVLLRAGPPFGISRVVVGGAVTLRGGHDRPTEHGVEIVLLDDPECVATTRDLIGENPAVRNEDIGE